MPRNLRSLLATALIAVLFPACQMEMGIGAKLNRNGSGTFTMAIAVDKEFIDGIAEANRRTGGATGLSGVQGFEEFFDSLKPQGWRVKQTKSPKGDVAFNAQCDFANVRGFDRCVQQVASADGGSSGLSFGNTGLVFDFGTKEGFFKTRTFFAGTANLTGPSGAQGQEMTRSIQALADQFFDFEIRAELPGSVRIVRGDGAVRDGVAVWSPRVGEKLEFRAEADAINPFSLVAIALPAFGAFGLAAWALMRRRRPGSGEGFVTPGEDGFSTDEPGLAEPDAEPALEHESPS